MAPIAVLAIDGVLRTPIGDGVITAGAVLYHGLAEVTSVALVCDEDVDKARHWLKVNGFKRHVYLIEAGPFAPAESGPRRLSQIRELKTYQPDIGFLVEPNPETAAYCVRNGVPVMAFAHPRYSQPEFRPDHEATIIPWSDFEAEVTRQEELRANDTRLGSTL